MGGQSPQSQAAASASKDAARNQQELASEVYPALRRLLTQTYGDINIDQTGKIGIPNSVQEQFGIAREGLDRDFDTAERGASAFTTQSFKQSGNPYSQGQLDATQMAQMNSLEQARTRAQGQLQFQEAQAGMGQFNQLMNLMSGGSGAALNLGSGYGAAQNAALQWLPQTSPGQGAMSGAMAGASLGSSIYPGWGTLIGGAIGAAGGYFGSG